MRVTLKDGILALATESDAEREAFAAWRVAAADHVFHFDGGTEKGGALVDLGPREHACRLPINIVFGDGPSPWQPISNLALTPFTLLGRSYASVEGFWQGLKYSSDEDRARVAALWGNEAKRAGGGHPESITYDGRSCAVGGPEHHALMAQACRAKFTQNQTARDALLATGDRPLTHRVRHDSKTIPGALMADIWMRIRAQPRNTSEPE